MIIAYDLGTGGVKASLYTDELETLAKTFVEYPTYYPTPKRHEQQPEDWWNGVVQSTRTLLEKSGGSADTVQCLSVSGHSLVSVPVDAKGNLLQAQVPIWSDSRAEEQATRFFETIEERQWYMKTGNGFPAPCYSLFKLMWLKENEPELFAAINKVMGSKDYINFRLTGAIATDHSYASGSGAYSLKKRRMKPSYLEVAGIPESIFPDIVPSHTIIGHITPDAAEEIGLPVGTPVACGGVDNACMALGAVGPDEGRVYISLGTSSWIPVNSARPILDFEKKPYVFAHIQEDMYTSAFSIFAGGSSLNWVRNTITHDLRNADNPFQLLDELAATSPAGSNGILFNPSLAGGTSQDKSAHIRGAYLGLHLGTTRQDLVRAAMEGITLNLKLSHDFMLEQVDLSNHLLICGGGGKSRFWLQMFADVFGLEIVKTNIDQDAASLGAAAIAARAIGLWTDYGGINALHRVAHRCRPDADNHHVYQKLLPVFRKSAEYLADVGDLINSEFETQDNKGE